MSAVDDVINWAQTELGKPYRWGDEGPGSFDCSGLMQFIFGKVGTTLPRTAAEQQAYATPVTTPAPGDLVFWGRPAYHVALYIGNGKIIAAPHSGANVEVENLYGAPSYGRVPGVGAGLAPVSAVLTGFGDTVAGWVGEILKPARNTALQILFVTAGVALIGAGLWRQAKPATV